jgi:hypothetical protein
MADPGSPVSFQVLTRIPRGEAYARLMTAVASVSGSYSDQVEVTSYGGNDITLVRKYLPTSMIVAAIISVFFCWLGLLLLLMRTTEVCQITLADAPQGTVITVQGKLSVMAGNTLNAALASFQI